MNANVSRAPRRNTRIAPDFLAIGAALLVALTGVWLLAGRDARGLGRALGVAGQWTISPAGAWPLAAWTVPLCLLFLLGGLAALSAYDRFRRAKNVSSARNSTRLCVLALSLLAALWPFATLNAEGAQNLIDATWGDTSNQYFSTAYEVENVRAFTREYSRLQNPPSPVQAHVATHPPGAVLLHFASRRFLESAPPLQDAFASLAQTLTGKTVAEIATHSNAVRRSVARAANAKTPRDLPQSAVGAALFSAFVAALFAALTVPAVYALAANSGARGTPESAPLEARGMTAAAFFALAPSILLFAWALDIVLACMAAWSLVFLAKRLRGGNTFWLLACGATLGATSFVSFGALAMFVALALMLALDAFCKMPDKMGREYSPRNASAKNIAMAPAAAPDKGAPPLSASHASTRDVPAPQTLSEQSAQPQSAREVAATIAPSSRASTRGVLLRDAARDFALILAGFCALWLLLWLIFPMNVVAIYTRAMDVHRTMTLSWRSRGVWTWMNVLMFFVFCGWPLVACVVSASTRARQLFRRDFSSLSDATFRLGIAALALMLLLTLSGQVRGEVERLWLFLLPPLCAMAGAYAAEKPRRACFLLALQATQTLLMASALAPLVRPL